MPVAVRGYPWDFQYRDSVARVLRMKFQLNASKITKITMENAAPYPIRKYVNALLYTNDTRM